MVGRFSLPKTKKKKKKRTKIRQEQNPKTTRVRKILLERAKWTNVVNSHSCHQTSPHFARFLTTLICKHLLKQYTFCLCQTGINVLQHGFLFWVVVVNEQKKNFEIQLWSDRLMKGCFTTENDNKESLSVSEFCVGTFSDHDKLHHRGFTWETAARFGPHHWRLFVRSWSGFICFHRLTDDVLKIKGCGIFYYPTITSYFTNYVSFQLILVQCFRCCQQKSCRRIIIQSCAVSDGLGAVQCFVNLYMRQQFCSNYIATQTDNFVYATIEQEHSFSNNPYNVVLQFCGVRLVNKKIEPLLVATQILWFFVPLVKTTGQKYTLCEPTGTRKCCWKTFIQLFVMKSLKTTSCTVSNTCVLSKQWDFVHIVHKRSVRFWQKTKTPIQ